MSESHLPFRIENVKAEGSWYEIGLAQGRALRTPMRFTIGTFTKFKQHHAGFPRVRALPEFARRVESFLSRSFPEEWAELNGMADGAEVDLSWLLASNFPEALDKVCAEVEPSPNPAERNCSGLMFPQSEWGPIIGGTLDDPPIHHLLTARPEGEMAFCCVMWPGRVACWGGMNEAGLALCGASAAVKRKENLWKDGRTLGLNTLWSARVVLRSCRTVKEALARMSQTELSNPGNLALLDSTGRGVLLQGYLGEAPRVRLQELEKEKGICWGNYFPWDIDPDDCDDIPEEERRPDAFSRYAALKRAVEQHQGAYSVEAMKTVLTSHEGPEDQPHGWSVCNDGTDIAMIAAPTQGKLLFASKPPCVQGFAEHSL